MSVGQVTSLMPWPYHTILALGTTMKEVTKFLELPPDFHTQCSMCDSSPRFLPPHKTTENASIKLQLCIKGKSSKQVKKKKKEKKQPVAAGSIFFFFFLTEAMSPFSFSKSLQCRDRSRPLLIHDGHVEHSFLETVIRRPSLSSKSSPAKPLRSLRICCALA